MIGTHSSKMFDSTLKQSAICADIRGNVPFNILCSSTINTERKYFALPRNAAEIRVYTEQAANITGDVEESIPGIEDGNIKQLLIPIDYHSDKYVSVSPVASSAVHYNMYKRLGQEIRPNTYINHKRWKLQITPPAMAGHGEVILKQGGAVKLLVPALTTNRDIGQFLAHERRQDGSDAVKDRYVSFTATLSNYNAASGMLCLGYPSITAIGGMVHAIERALGFDIDFAVGLAYTEVSDSGKIIPKYVGKNIANRALVLDEITATGEIVILLRGDKLSHIVKELEKISRVAGGSFFDAKIETSYHKEPPRIGYLTDMTSEVKLDGDEDVMDYVLKMADLQNNFLNMSGYAFLEDPKEKNRSRGGYPHAWAEPLFSVVRQTQYSSAVWWTRSVKDFGVLWHARDNDTKYT